MISSELYEQVVLFIDDEISLRELEDWYAPRILHYFDSPYAGDDELIATIEHALAELTAGILDLAGVKAQLSKAISESVVVKVWLPEVDARGNVTTITTSLSPSGPVIFGAASATVIDMTDGVGLPAIRMG